MIYRAYFEDDSNDELFIVIDSFEFAARGQWINFVFAETGDVQVIPAIQVRRIVLEENIHTGSDVEHVIHLANENDDRGEYVLASAYELRTGWIEYVDAERAERILAPPHTIEAIDVDVSPLATGTSDRTKPKDH